MLCLSLSLTGSSGFSRVPAEVSCAGRQASPWSHARLHRSTIHEGLNFSIWYPFAFRPSNCRLLHSSSPNLSTGGISCCGTAPGNHANGYEDYPLLKSWIRSLAAAIIGFLLFVGRFGCRPALSIVDAQYTGAPTEEKLVTQNDKAGEEEELLARLLETNPKDVESLKMVFYEKMKKGKTREAVDYVERLIDAEPDEVEWRLLQALCYEFMGRLEKAKKLFKDILEERPLLLRALHGLALVMHKNREGPAVFEMLRKALELARREQRATEERNIRILIAQMHVVKGDHVEGLAEFKALIDEINGDLEGGLARFQKLAEENPRDFRPYLCQGIIYSLLERKEEAEEQFEIYRSLVPDEFPQRSFLDDVILSAKAESEEDPKGQPEPSK